MNMSYSLVIFVCCILLHYAQGDYSDPNSPSPSPPSNSCAVPEIVDNYADPLIAQAMKRAIVHDIWKSPLFKKLTPLLTEMRDILIEMADSDSIFFTDIAFSISVMDTGFLANAETIYPSFCQMAQVINKTVEYKETGKLDIYFEAVNISADVIEVILSSFRYNVLSQLRCDNLTEAKHVTRQCWKNGFASLHYELFTYYGNLIPCCLRNVIEQLYESPVFSDKAQATIATVALAPSCRILFQRVDFAGLAQDLLRFSTASKVSKCCCDEWSRAMKEEHLKRINDAHEDTRHIIEEGSSCDGKVYAR